MIQYVNSNNLFISLTPWVAIRKKCFAASWENFATTTLSRKPQHKTSCSVNNTKYKIVKDNTNFACASSKLWSVIVIICCSMSPMSLRVSWPFSVPSRPESPPSDRCCEAWWTELRTCMPVWPLMPSPRPLVGPLPVRGCCCNIVYRRTAATTASLLRSELQNPGWGDVRAAPPGGHRGRGSQKNLFWQNAHFNARSTHARTHARTGMYICMSIVLLVAVDSVLLIPL